MLEHIRAWHAAMGERWAPAPLLATLAEQDLDFADATPGTVSAQPVTPVAMLPR